MKFRLEQMSLFIAITKEVERQAKTQGLDTKKLNVEIYQMDAIAKGATQIVEEFNREKKESAPNMGLSAWLKSDDTGLSSKAMAYKLFGVAGHIFRDAKAHPHDGADFGRCHRFLEAVPGTRERVSEMASVSPMWAKLAEAWSELTALYLEELPTGSVPKLYAKMRELGC